MFVKFGKNVTIFALLMAIAILVPTAAFAADGNVFNIISSKMIRTLQDVRKIVYVIAGFGLIMFAVLAIFNKISFKHLAYIIIGLSLLAVMMPFINYFSGANLEDSEYNYGNFINKEDPTVKGSDIEQDLSKNDICQGPDCPGRITGIDPDERLKAEASTQGPDMPGVDTKWDSDWDSNGCRYVDGKKECCEGKIKDGVCKKKFTFQDAMKTGQDIINAGKSVVNAVEYGMSTADAIKQGIQNVNDIISGDGSAWDKLGDLAASIGSSIDRISSGTNAALGSVGGGLGYAGSAGDRMYGDERVSDALSGTKDLIEDTKDAVGDVSGGIKDGTNTAGDIYGMGNDVKNMGDRVGSWFDK